MIHEALLHIGLLVGLLLVTPDFPGVDFALNLEFTKALCLARILSLSSLGIVAKVLSRHGTAQGTDRPCGYSPR